MPSSEQGPQEVPSKEALEALKNQVVALELRVKMQHSDWTVDQKRQTEAAKSEIKNFLMRELGTAEKRILHAFSAAAPPPRSVVKEALQPGPAMHESDIKADNDFSRLEASSLHGTGEAPVPVQAQGDDDIVSEHEALQPRSLSCTVKEAAAAKDVRLGETNPQHAVPESSMVSSKTQGQGDEQAADFKSAPFKPLCTGDTQCQLPLLMDSMAWMPNAIQSQAAMQSRRAELSVWRLLAGFIHAEANAL
ncbi:hypothetical protein WJX74_000749 [Apatococcus lobatus]|uniref:Uncharacterized protein n=1 Tax=Apatococcus lobatus TaxID=904363 RepID=A0AAW1QXE5_9CHLO